MHPLTCCKHTFRVPHRPSHGGRERRLCSHTFSHSTRRRVDTVSEGKRRANEDQGAPASKPSRCATRQAQGSATSLQEQEQGEEEEPRRSMGRRASLLGSMGAATLTLTPAREAVAFPSQSLESLQESAASRSAGDHGITALRNPAIYRGAATEKAVRRVYGIDGLLPSRRAGLQEEVDRAKLWVDACCNPLDKYQALMTLKETNRDCFFGLLSQNVAAYLPIVYTPTVGEACQKWSRLLHRPTGLYVSMNDLGNVRSLVSNWPEDEAKIAVLTDGERILGIGDLGVNGLGICVGKAIVHSLAGVHPRFLIPVVVDVGCNQPAVRNDPFYLGMDQERARGQNYGALIDELIDALRERYGSSLLVHWEDFAARNSYRLLARARERGVSTFNDDIESTAAAIVASFLGAEKLKGVPALKDQTVLMLGAGQANIGGARLLTKAFQACGLSRAEAKQRIWLFDSKGVVFEGRTSGTITPEKEEFQRPAAEGPGFKGKSFEEVVNAVRPTAIVGAAAKRGSFSQAVVERLVQGTEARFDRNARPLILALSNPDSVAECTAEEAYRWSNGKAVYASGTTFPPVATKNGSQYVASQANNSLIFPGVGLGCIASGATLVTDDMMLVAARAVTRKLTEEELGQTSILPATERLREVALGVAAAVALAATEGMVASSTGADILSCLPLGKGPDDEAALKQAEACIAKLRFDPFANEQGRS